MNKLARRPLEDGWDLNKFPEKRPPSRQDLDAVAPNNPVVIYLSRGQAYLNSAALKLAGVTRDMSRIGRVVITKDSTGEPNGSITGETGTVARLTGVVSPATEEEKEKLLLEIQKQQLALGLTSIRDLQLAPDFMRTYYTRCGGPGNFYSAPAWDCKSIPATWRHWKIC